MRIYFRLLLGMIRKVAGNNRGQDGEARGWMGVA